MSAQQAAASLELLPFVFTTRANAPYLRLDSDQLGLPLELIWVEDPYHASFGALLNHTNQLAFGGANMGMPMWVLLDCGILPSAVVGFAVRRDALDAAQRERLGVPEDYEHPLVPVSEYCGSLMVEPGGICGFSLQSQLEGFGLGTRTKALAMWVYKGTFQVGVTQFDNAAIRVHSRLGPLQFQIHRPSVHTHPQNSFVYRVTLPSPAVLAKMARGEIKGVEPDGLPDGGERWIFRIRDEDEHARLAELVAGGVKVWIVPPAWYDAEDGPVLELFIAP